MNTEPLKIVPGEQPLDLLARCGGYYERAGSGPLVGYAGTYGEDKRQYVGEIYANFAKIECRGNALKYVADRLLEQLPFLLSATGDGFCAAPEGGKALAVMLAGITGKDYIFPEKQEIEAKSATSRGKSILVWKRHEPRQGASYWIVEDTCNNFSTTAGLIRLIESRRAIVRGIICFLNRSLKVDGIFAPEGGGEYPVYALVTKPIPEYTQDDPHVAADIAAGNVVWKPKDEWDKLFCKAG